MYTIHRIRNTKKKIQTVHYGESILENENTSS
jgi:hypothetical protein